MRCSAGSIKEGEESLSHITKTEKWKNKGGLYYDSCSENSANCSTDLKYYHSVWILSDRREEQRALQTCHWSECIFLLRSIRSGIDYDVCRTECTGGGCGSLCLYSNGNGLYRGRTGYRFILYRRRYRRGKCSERGTWRDQRGLQRPW